VAYECNLSQVKDLLLKAAHESPDVLSRPEPIVELKGFGGSSVDFSLFVFIDVSNAIRVRTDLSIAIFNAFADAGISIPFTQADIKIRDLDQVRDAIAGYVSQLQGRETEAGRKPLAKISAVE
jgi:small-conductance mechanosensitive channel